MQEGTVPPSTDDVVKPRLQPAQSAWASLPHDPTKVATVAYVWLSVVGFAHLFGRGMAFNINVIDLASPSDFLLAGFRDPFVTILAVASGIWLHRIWAAAVLDRRRWTHLIAIASVLILSGTFLSWLYRKSVVTGGLKDSWGTPRPMTVVTDGPVRLEDVRLGVSTSNFIVFASGTLGTVIVPKSDIKSITIGAPRLGPAEPALE